MGPVMNYYSIQRWQQGQWRTMRDTVADEIPVRITWGQNERLLWASPHDLNLDRLALGHVVLHLAAQKTLWAPQGIVGAMRPCCSVEPVQNEAQDVAFTVRISSDMDKTLCMKPFCQEKLTPEKLFTAMHILLHQADLWQATGCFHRCGVWDPQQEDFVYMAEDIGRHNCIDKVMGWALQTKQDLSAYVLFLSARITASLYNKIRRTGARCLVSAGAVSMHAIRQATSDGITLVGFCRPCDKRLNLYTGSLLGSNLEDMP